MNEYTKVQIRLQNELSNLLGCRATLRECWLENQSPEIFAAIENIGIRLVAAESELNAAIGALELNDALPIVTLTPKKMKI